MRMWQVSVVNVDESGSESLVWPYGKVACKFTLADSVWREMTVDQFETAIQMELIQAVRKIKAEMIMKGMEP